MVPEGILYAVRFHVHVRSPPALALTDDAELPHAFWAG
jgi:hypothetical protein